MLPAAYTGVDNVVINLISYAGSLFDSISFEFEDLGRHIELSLIELKDPNTMVALKLTDLIEKHVTAIKFTQKLEVLITSLTVVQFTGAAVQICLSGFIIMTVTDPLEIVTFTFYFLTQFQPFFVCTMGTSLSESVSYLTLRQGPSNLTFPLLMFFKEVF